MGVVSVCGKRYEGVKKVLLNMNNGKLYLHWKKSCEFIALSRPYLLCNDIVCQRLETANYGVLCEQGSKIYQVLSGITCVNSVDRGSSLYYYSFIPDNKFDESLQGIRQKSSFVGNCFVELRGTFDMVGILSENKDFAEIGRVLCTVFGNSVVGYLSSDLVYCLGDVDRIDTHILVERRERVC